MRSIWILLLLLIAAAPAGARERMAVLDLKPVGVDENLAMAVSENLRTMIIAGGRYEIVERTQIDKLLQEYRLGQTGLTEDGHARKIGSLANVDLVLLGSLSRIFECYSINARIINVETGVVIAALKVEILSQANFPPKIDELALHLGTPDKLKPVSADESIDINGTYRTKGEDYVGLLTISKRNDIYQLSWEVDNSQTDDAPQFFKGAGILHDGVLSVYYRSSEEENNYGVAAYEVLLGGRQLRGLYTNLGASRGYGKVHFENGVKQN
ncbi:MAG: CsgG/HfaB family protein [Desulfobacterales bacterium]